MQTLRESSEWTAWKTLTSRDRAILRRLVRDEARRLGYGSRYNEANKPLWSDSLRRLNTVMRKLRDD